MGSGDRPGRPAAGAGGAQRFAFLCGTKVAVAGAPGSAGVLRVVGMVGRDEPDRAALYGRFHDAACGMLYGLGKRGRGNEDDSGHGRLDMVQPMSVARLRPRNSAGHRRGRPPAGTLETPFVHGFDCSSVPDGGQSDILRMSQVGPGGYYPRR